MLLRAAGPGQGPAEGGGEGQIRVAVEGVEGLLRLREHGGVVAAAGRDGGVEFLDGGDLWRGRVVEVGDADEVLDGPDGVEGRLRRGEELLEDEGLELALRLEGEPAVDLAVVEAARDDVRVAAAVLAPGPGAGPVLRGV